MKVWQGSLRNESLGKSSCSWQQPNQLTHSLYTHTYSQSRGGGKRKKKSNKKEEEKEEAGRGRELADDN
jgi:hypothetical protein